MALCHFSFHDNAIESSHDKLNLNACGKYACQTWSACSKLCVVHLLELTVVVEMWFKALLLDQLLETNVSSCCAYTAQ